MTADVAIERCVDSALSEADGAELRGLLHEAFGDYYADRIFFKQIPHERILLRTEAGIVGQCGLDHRVMRADDRVIYTLGVVDLCVRKELRGRRLGERLVREVLAVGQARRVDHVVLLARDGRLYRRLGFSPLTAEVTWLGIEDLRSVAVLTETLTDEIYTHPIRATHPLRVRHLDFLGYMFLPLGDAPCRARAASISCAHANAPPADPGRAVRLSHLARSAAGCARRRRSGGRAVGPCHRDGGAAGGRAARGRHAADHRGGQPLHRAGGLDDLGPG